MAWDNLRAEIEAEFAQQCGVALGDGERIHVRRTRARDRAREIARDWHELAGGKLMFLTTHERHKDNGQEIATWPK